MSLFAVELKVIGTFSSYIEASSQEDAETLIKQRARDLQPDSVVFDAIAYENLHCDMCGQEHFGPACMKPVAKLIAPSWERERL